MIQYMLRLAKRFAILVPGVVIAFFSVRNIFPYFDQRLPLGLAIFVTYVIAAYVLIPALIRLIRIIHPPDHLPLYCVTPDGFASDPLNIGVIGTRRELITAMESSGWHVADRHTFKNVARLVFSVAFDHPYPNAPVSSLYLFGRKQDIAFEIPVPGSSSERHHVRFWATTYDDKKIFSIKTIHWQNRKRHVFGDDLLWVGAASLDIGLTFIRHNLQVSHMIDPDTNKEREYIVDQLKQAKLVSKTNSVKLDNPYRLANRVLRGSLHTDGKMKIVSLRHSAQTKATSRRSHSRSR
jgi:hypothetical protein